MVEFIKFLIFVGKRIAMRMTGTYPMWINIDPIDAIRAIEDDWLEHLQDVWNKDGYIKDGFWYVDDQYGPDQKREATAEETQVYEAFNTLVTHLKKSKK